MISDPFGYSLAVRTGLHFFYKSPYMHDKAYRDFSAYYPNSLEKFI